MDNDAKDLLLNGLHCLLSHNVVGDKQYRNRYNGFVAELHIADWIRNHRKKPSLAGGAFIPLTKGSDNPFTNSVYYTVGRNSTAEYEAVYRKAERLATNDLFYIRYEKTATEEWSELELSFASGANDSRLSLPCPPLSFHKYDRSSQTFHDSSLQDFKAQFSYKARKLAGQAIPQSMRLKTDQRLRQHSLESLTDLYVTRLIFDGFTGLNSIRGAPLDIDAFVFHPKEDLVRILEVKEKDLSKTPPCGFGMDIRRVDSLATLEENFEMRCVYLVREISGQTMRDFRAWKYIFMDEFRMNVDYEKAINGGFGMGIEGKTYLTVICPEDQFNTLSDKY